MKKSIFILLTFCFAFSVTSNAASEVFKEKRNFVKEQTKGQIGLFLSFEDVLISEEHSDLSHLTPIVLQEYCLSYGITLCSGQCVDLTYCSSFSWQDAYNWVVLMQKTQEAELESCE